jgi:hypothetical protein
VDEDGCRVRLQILWQVDKRIFFLFILSNLLILAVVVQVTLD